MRKLVLLALMTSLSLATMAHDRVTMSITWNREIPRIVYDRCASYHRQGGTAFSLMTYEDARLNLTLIREFKLDGILPQEVPAGVLVRILAELPDGRIEPFLWLYEYKEAAQTSVFLPKTTDAPAGYQDTRHPGGASIVLLPA
jgi:hypothetical protein